MVSTEHPRTKILVGVASTLIAGVIIYFAKQWWPLTQRLLASIFSSVWRFLISGHAIPGWLLLIFVASVITVIVGIVAVVHQPPNAREPTESDYVQDTFFGLTWRWRHIQNEIYNVVPFCAGCDMQIHPTFDYVGTLETRTGYKCDNCTHHVSLDGSHEFIVDQVTRQIHRNLRSGEWKEVVINQSL